MLGKQEKRCAVCSKALPDDYAGDRCSLCAIGLTPRAEVDEDRPPYQPIEGRTLTGIECPNCHAELTIADLSRGSCAICSSPLSRTITHPGFGQVRHDQVVSRPAQEPSAGVKSWPDDAPLW